MRERGANIQHAATKITNMPYWGNGFCAVAGEGELKRGRGFGDRN